jgi:hypothetical protein
MAAKDSLIFVMHIRDACEAIQYYSEFRHNTAVPERIVLDAVCRRFEINCLGHRRTGYSNAPDKRPRTACGRGPVMGRRGSASPAGGRWVLLGYNRNQCREVYSFHWGPC